MKVVIVGDGKVGGTIARQLSGEGQPLQRCEGAGAWRRLQIRT